MSKNIDLSIIIVSYNGAFWLKKTLETLDEHYLQKTARAVEVIVVDNGSDDELLSMVREHFSWVQLIELTENKGFAGANNIGIDRAHGKYVMLLNPDTQLDQRSNIDNLVDYLQSHKKVGMIGPKLEMTDGRLDLACHRGEPTLWAAACYFGKLEKLWPRWRVVNGYHRHDLDLEKIHPIDAISGAAMVLPRRVIDQIGLLDERFFLYAEDLDWARRVREAGYQVVYDPEVTIIHHKNKTGIANQDAKISGRSREYFFDTMLQYYDKYYGEKLPRFVRNIVKAAVFVKKQDI